MFFQPLARFGFHRKSKHLDSVPLIIYIVEESHLINTQTILRLAQCFQSLGTLDSVGLEPSREET